jgi:hypothetical protein
MACIVQAYPHHGAGAGQRGADAKRAGCGNLGQVPGCEGITDPGNAAAFKEGSVDIGRQAGEGVPLSVGLRAAGLNGRLFPAWISETGKFHRSTLLRACSNRFRDHETMRPARHPAERNVTAVDCR